MNVLLDRLDEVGRQIGEAVILARVPRYLVEEFGFVSSLKLRRTTGHHIAARKLFHGVPVPLEMSRRARVFGPHRSYHIEARFPIEVLDSFDAALPPPGTFGAEMVLGHGASILACSFVAQVRAALVTELREGEPDVAIVARPWRRARARCSDARSKKVPRFARWSTTRGSTWHAFISVRRTYPLLTFLICWDIRIQLPSPARSSDGPGVRREQTIALKANLSAAQCARIHALEE